jgi:hypothetical protein
MMQFQQQEQDDSLQYLGGFMEWDCKNCVLLKKFVLGTSQPHCNKNPIYVFHFWELRSSLSPNFHIHVSLNDLYIPRIGPHISCSRIGRLIVGIYKSLTDTWMRKLGLWPCNSVSRNICFKFSLLVLSSAD